VCPRQSPSSRSAARSPPPSGSRWPQVRLCQRLGCSRADRIPGWTEGKGSRPQSFVGRGRGPDPSGRDDRVGAARVRRSARRRRPRTSARGGSSRRCSGRTHAARATRSALALLATVRTRPSYAGSAPARLHPAPPSTSRRPTVAYGRQRTLRAAHRHAPEVDREHRGRPPRRSAWQPERGHCRLPTAQCEARVRRCDTPRPARTARTRGRPFNRRERVGGLVLDGAAGHAGSDIALGDHQQDGYRG
jgi:hypothetical protein